MRLAAQVQARIQQPAAEDWQCSLLLVVAHESNLAAVRRAVQAGTAIQVAS